MTLEEYLERFVDENTQSAPGDSTLLLSDAEAVSLGLFFISGLTGYIERLRIDRDSSLTAGDLENDQDDQVRDDLDQEDFIN